MKLKLPIRPKSIPRIGYLLAVVIVLNAVGLIYIASSLGLPSKVGSLIKLTISKPKLASNDYREYLTLTGKIEALRVKLPAEGAISERLKTSLEELKNELGDNKAVLEDPRTTAITTEKTRERNKVIAQTLDQMEKDVGNGFGGFAAFEAAANEQEAINSAFYSAFGNTTTTNNNSQTNEISAPKEVDTDPVIACTFDHCGVVNVKQSECTGSVCCPIGNDWKWEKTESACSDEQHSYEERKVSTSLYLDGLNFTRSCNANKTSLFNSLEIDYVKAAQEWYCQEQCYNQMTTEKQKEQENNQWLASQGKPIPASNYANNWSACSNKCCGLDSNSDKYCPGARNSGNGYDYEGPTKEAKSKTNGIGDEINKNIGLYCE